jgi:hypothetical protein
MTSSKSACAFRKSSTRVLCWATASSAARVAACFRLLHLLPGHVAGLGTDELFVGVEVLYLGGRVLRILGVICGGLVTLRGGGRCLGVRRGLALLQGFELLFELARALRGLVGLALGFTLAGHGLTDAGFGAALLGSRQLARRFGYLGVDVVFAVLAIALTLVARVVVALGRLAGGRLRLTVRGFCFAGGLFRSSGGGHVGRLQGVEVYGQRTGHARERVGVR